MPDDLRERIKAAADKSGRTMTAEIVSTLEEKYPNITLEQVKDRIAEVLKILHEAEPGFVASDLVAEFQALVVKFNDLEDAKETSQKDEG